MHTWRDSLKSVTRIIDVVLASEDQILSTHCNTLQHTATHCNVPQHLQGQCNYATHCNTLHHFMLVGYGPIFRAHCNTLQFDRLQKSAMSCNTLCLPVTFKSMAGNANTLQHTATHCNTLHHTEPHCTTLQHTATPCARQSWSSLSHTLVSRARAPAPI